MQGTFARFPQGPRFTPSEWWTSPRQLLMRKKTPRLCFRLAATLFAAATKNGPIQPAKSEFSENRSRKPHHVGAVTGLKEANSHHLGCEAMPFYIPFCTDSKRNLHNFICDHHSKVQHACKFGTKIVRYSTHDLFDYDWLQSKKIAPIPHTLEESGWGRACCSLAIHY